MWGSFGDPRRETELSAVCRAALRPPDSIVRQPHFYHGDPSDLVQSSVPLPFKHGTGSSASTWAQEMGTHCNVSSTGWPHYQARSKAHASPRESFHGRQWLWIRPSVQSVTSSALLCPQWLRGAGMGLNPRATWTDPNRSHFTLKRCMTGGEHQGTVLV